MYFSCRSSHLKISTHFLLAFFSIFLCTLYFSEKSTAQDHSTTVIAVVEGQFVLRESFASKAIQKQIEIRRNQYQLEISAKEKVLRERERELLQQQSVLSAEAFAQYRREWETDVTVVKRIVAERRGQLDKAYAKGMKIIQLEVSQILKELSSEMNISLIIPVSQTLFFDQKLNISREVLQRLNARLPNLKLEFESQ